MANARKRKAAAASKIASTAAEHDNDKTINGIIIKKGAGCARDVVAEVAGEHNIAALVREQDGADHP